MLLDPYRFGDPNRLLWLRAEGTVGATSPIDSSQYARVPYATQGAVSTAQTKCGSSVYGIATGYQITYNAAAMPVFEDEPFVIQMHWYNNAGGATERPLVARLADTFTLHGWRLRASTGTGLIFQTWNSGGTQLYDKTWTMSTSTGLWRHIALEWTGSALNCYLDEVALSVAGATGTPQVIAPSVDFKFGWDTSTAAGQSYGFVDEVTVDRYPRAISMACPV